MTVTAVEDSLLNVGAVHNTRVTRAFGDQKECIVDKVIIGTNTQEVVTASTTWIQCRPSLSISGEPYSPRSWYIPSW